MSRGPKGLCDSDGDTHPLDRFGIDKLRICAQTPGKVRRQPQGTHVGHLSNSTVAFFAGTASNGQPASCPLRRSAPVVQTQANQLAERIPLLRCATAPLRWTGRTADLTTRLPA